MKYLHFDDIYDTVIVFPDFLDHSEVARAHNKEVISAGFCYIEYLTDGTVSACVYGKSISLNKEPNPDVDMILLNKLFKLDHE